MIFVTVSVGPFERMIKVMDELAPKLGEEILMQIGMTEYEPKNCKFFSFCSKIDIRQYFKKSDLIITHGGCGSIVTALRLEKKCISLPRYHKYNEHVDDHQLQIVRELEKQKRLIAVYDVNDLEEAIRKARRFKPVFKRDSSLVEHVKSIIGASKSYNKHSNAS